MEKIESVDDLEGFIKVHHINIEEELVTATAAVVDTEILKRLRLVYKPEYMTNEMAKTVVGWCLEYYKEHKQAPRGEIEDIYNLEKGKLNDGLAGLIGGHLTKISNIHLTRESFNTEFYWKRIVEYFRHRRGMLFALRLGALSKMRDQDGFQKALLEFRDIPAGLSLRSCPWTKERIRRAFVDDGRDEALRLPKAVGELVGPLSRGELVLFLGGTGHGKTFWLLECARQAALQKRNVIFFDLDDSEVKIDKRFFRIVNHLPKYPDVFDLSVFDCERNQCAENQCHLKFRTGDGYLYKYTKGEDDDDFDDKDSRYYRGHPHRVCTYCRDTPEQFDGRENPYRMAVWKETVDARDLKNHYRIVGASYRKDPSEFASVDMLSFAGKTVFDFQRHLEMLELQDQFAPDVIVVDYADRFKKKSRESEYRHKLNEIYEVLKEVAVTRNALVITASQINKQGWEREHIRKSDVAEDSRKITHADVVITIGRNARGVAEGTHTIGVDKIRDDVYRPNTFACVCERRELHQIHHDSELYELKTMAEREIESERIYFTRRAGQLGD